VAKISNNAHVKSWALLICHMVFPSTSIADSKVRFLIFKNNNNMKDSEVHIGTIVKEKFDDSKMSIEIFADAIHRQRNSVYDIFKRKSIDTELLIKISKTLNYNFFLEYDFFENHAFYNKKTTITIEIETDDLDKVVIPDNILKLITN
jgi:phosphorylcholine metabolism protein LicD